MVPQHAGTGESFPVPGVCRRLPPPYGRIPSSRATPSSANTAMLAYHLW